jgi:glycosyltransferase involved in cell wall biosynthesis
MRKLYFLLPGTTQKFHCGGLWAELKAMHLAQQVCAAEVVTYRQRQPDALFLDDLLQAPSTDCIFVVSWGFDVPKLVKRLNHQNVVYHAHTAEYGFSLPSEIPIITVSRNTLGYWGQRSPHALLYYLPNQISDEFRQLNLARDIDVMVQARKSSSYLMRSLIPTLQRQCQVYVVDHYVDDLAALFNRSKVYLYDSAEYWAQRGVTEGFGLQPMEAMACGCQVFSSVNHGLSDYLDPGFNCQKIAGYALEYDVERIAAAIASPAFAPLTENQLNEHRAETLVKRLVVILSEINHFFDRKSSDMTRIPDLTPIRLAQLRANAALAKIKTKLIRKR